MIYGNGGEQMYSRMTDGRERGLSQRVRVPENYRGFAFSDENAAQKGDENVRSYGGTAQKGDDNIRSDGGGAQKGDENIRSEGVAQNDGENIRTDGSVPQEGYENIRSDSDDTQKDGGRAHPFRMPVFERDDLLLLALMLILSDGEAGEDGDDTVIMLGLLLLYGFLNR